MKQVVLWGLGIAMGYVLVRQYPELRRYMKIERM